MLSFNLSSEEKNATTSLLKFASPAALMSNCRAVISEVPSCPLSSISLSSTSVTITKSLEAFLNEAINQLAEKYLELYGVKNQRLKCKNVKELGSKQPTHRCNKIEISNGYYFVDDQQQYNAMIDN